MDTICKYIKTNILKPSDKKKFITKKLGIVLMHMPYISFEWVKNKTSTGESKYAYTLRFNYINCSNKELDTLTERKNMIYEELISIIKMLKNDNRFSKKKMIELMKKIEENTISENDNKTRAVHFFKLELSKCWEDLIKDQSEN